MRRTGHLWLLLVCFFAPVAAGIDVEIRTVDGRIETGALTGITAAGSLVLKTSTAVLELPMGRILSVRFGANGIDRPKPGSGLLQFDLQRGDRLFGAIVDSDYDTVRVETRVAGTFPFPLDHLRLLTVLDQAAGLPTRLGEDLPTDRDIVFIRSQTAVDSVVGEVARFARGGVYFSWADDEEKLFKFHQDKVIAVRLAQAPGIGREDDDPGLTAVVYGRDGSRLSGRLSLRGETLELIIGPDSKLSLVTSEINEIAFLGGDYVYLSDREATRVVETPYIEGGLSYGVRRDVGLRGDPVTVAGEYFPKALATHTRCAVAFQVAGFAQLSTAAGVDDAVAGAAVRGAVAFSVRVDDKVVAGPVVVRAGEPAHWFRGIDLTGAKTVELVADFADNFHFNGWAVWGSPMLIRNSDG